MSGLKRVTPKADQNPRPAPVEPKENREILDFTEPTEEQQAADANFAVDHGSLIPGTVNGMFFQQFILHPERTMSLEDVTEILKLIQITLGQKHFESLPESTRKHFMVINRDGNHHRYGRRPRR